MQCGQADNAFPIPQPRLDWPIPIVVDSKKTLGLSHYDVGSSRYVSEGPSSTHQRLFPGGPPPGLRAGRDGPTQGEGKVSIHLFSSIVEYIGLLLVH